MSTFRLPLVAEDCNVIDADGQALIASYDSEDYNILTPEQAAEIVEAVNSHRLLAMAIEALKLEELVDDHIAACEDCGDGAFPELCELGFPIADNARIARRDVLARIRAARLNTKS